MREVQGQAILVTCRSSVNGIVIALALSEPLPRLFHRQDAKIRQVRQVFLVMESYIEHPFNFKAHECLGALGVSWRLGGES